MWNDKSISVILPTYREKDSIAACINAFDKLGIVDDIIVINNNAEHGTSEEVAGTVAREVVETMQGYGAAIARGIIEAKTDLVCVCEPDGTFEPRDLLKLLAFASECDVVIGSRTVSNFIWDGANMGLFLRWGNWAVAKVIEVIYNTAYLSDVGCTFRVMTADRAQEIIDLHRTSGSAFGLEMLLLSIIRRARLVQVPVNYYPRVGESSVTGHLGKTIRLGSQMMAMVLRYRLQARRIRSANPGA